MPDCGPGTGTNYEKRVNGTRNSVRKFQPGKRAHLLTGAFHSTKIPVWNFGNFTCSMERYIPVAQTRSKPPRFLFNIVASQHTHNYALKEKSKYCLYPKEHSTVEKGRWKTKGGGIIFRVESLWMQVKVKNSCELKRYVSQNIRTFQSNSTGNPGSVIVPQYSSTKITNLVPRFLSYPPCGFCICWYPISTILACLFSVGVRISWKKLCWMRVCRRKWHLVFPTLYIIIVYRVNVNKLLQIITKPRWSNKDNNN